MPPRTEAPLCLCPTDTCVPAGSPEQPAGPLPPAGQDRAGSHVAFGARAGPQAAPRRAAPPAEPPAPAGPPAARAGTSASPQRFPAASRVARADRPRPSRPAPLCPALFGALTRQSCRCLRTSAPACGLRLLPVSGRLSGE